MNLQMITEDISSIKEDIRAIKRELALNLISEGVHDPGIFKCVFMAGGPASGKSFTANAIFGVDAKFRSSFSSTGLKLVNSDAAFEKGLRDNGINPKDLARIESEEPELWDKITKTPNGIRDKAKQITVKMKKFYEAGRLGMIIDGTGDDFNKIKKQKDHAESLGYDCTMVFVNTSLEVAIKRNSARDRVLPEELVREIWKDCQENMGKYQSLFGGSAYHIVDNTVYGPPASEVQKAINRFIAAPVRNPIGKKWIETAKSLQKAKLIK
jgi:hypothetical protein